MALTIGSTGSVRPQDRSRQYSRQSATAEDMGAGVGRALQGVGASVESWAQFKQQRDRQTQDNEAALGFERLQGESTRRLQELQNESPEDAAGFTDQAEELLRTESETFLASITDPEVRARYETQIESLVQNGTTQAFTFEYERGNAAFVRGSRDRLNDAQTRLYLDPNALDTELETLEASIRASTLSEPEKEALIDEAYAGLASTAYQASLENALNNNVPQGPTDGPNAVAPGLSGGQAGMLSAISGTESGGRYNVLNGGETITDMSDHPRRRGAGGTTTAAGKYQFIADTWDMMVDLMAAEGTIIPDFSPVSQDRVAVRYAQYTWENSEENNGKSFNEVLTSGDGNDAAALRRALAGPTRERAIWQGLHDMTDAEFATALGAGQPTGGSSEGIPDPVTDERFADLPYEARIQMHNAATQAVAQRRQARVEAERDAQINLHTQLATALQNGEPSALQNIQAALKDGTISDLGMRDDLIRRTTERNSEATKTAAVENAIAIGQSLTSSDESDVMAYMQSRGILPGIAQSDPASATRLLADVGKMNYVPQPLVDMLLAQSNGSNPGAASFAAETLTALYRQNPSTFAQYATEDQYRAASSMDIIQRTSATPEEASERQRFMTDPRFAADRKVLQEQAEVELETLTSANVEAALDSSSIPFMGQAPLPGNPGEMSRLTQQYRDLYTEGFIRSGGKADEAKEYAATALGYNWGPDPISGALMEYSPLAAGANVPLLGGSREYVGEALRESLQIPDEANLSLVPDAQTLGQLARGETPTYRAVIETEDENGFPVISVAPTRATIQPTESQRAQAEYELEVTRLEKREEMLSNMFALMPASQDEGAVPADLRRVQRRLAALREGGPEVLREGTPPLRPRGRQAQTPPPSAPLNVTVNNPMGDFGG